MANWTSASVLGSIAGYGLLGAIASCGGGDNAVRSSAHDASADVGPSIDSSMQPLLATDSGSIDGPAIDAVADASAIPDGSDGRRHFSTNHPLLFSHRPLT